MLHSLSRTLHEEVQFDTEKVTSVDWVTHPTLTHLDTPERIDVVIVNGDPNPNRPDLPHYGAGETVCKPTLAAVANAILRCDGRSVADAFRSAMRGCLRRSKRRECRGTKIRGADSVVQTPIFLKKWRTTGLAP